MTYVKINESTCILVFSSIILLLLFSIFFIMGESTSDDILVFQEYAEMIKSGLIPYKDFTFEFPPLSLIFFVVPSLFTSDLDTYALLFGLQVTFFSLISLYFILKIADRFGTNKKFVAFLFLLFMVLYFNHAIKKFDITAVAFTVMSIYMFLERRYASAYGLVTAAALIKLYPALLLPIFLAINWMAEGKIGKRHAAIGVTIFTVVSILVAVPFLFLSVTPAELLSFIGFHSDRGFQVESIVAVFVLTLSELGLTVAEIVPANYTYDVLSPICDALLPIWPVVMGMVLIIALAFILRDIRTKWDWSDHFGSMRRLVAYAVLIILAFLLANKVFSTQYITWLFPLLPFLAIDRNNKINKTATVVFSTIVLLSVLMISFDSLMLPLNLLRNVILILIFISVLRGVIKRDTADRKYLQIPPIRRRHADNNA